MALDKIRLLVNKIRRLSESNDDGENDSKLDDLYEELNDEIEKADIKVRLVAKVDRIVSLNEVDNWEEWLVDRLIEDDENDPSPAEILADDICRSGDDGLSYYIDMEDDDIEAHVYDENGKEICNNKG